MKAIAEGVPNTYLEEFDVHVNKRLSYAEIQSIVNATEALMKTETTTKRGEMRLCNSWAERQENIDMLVLLFATDIGKEKLQEISHLQLLHSGLIDAVKNNIENYWQLEVAFNYTNSWDKLLVTAMKGITDILKASNPKETLEAIKNGDLLNNS